jgi:hypothetical protein
MVTKRGKANATNQNSKSPSLWSQHNVIYQWLTAQKRVIISNMWYPGRGGCIHDCEITQQPPKSSHRLLLRLC